MKYLIIFIFIVIYNCSWAQAPDPDFMDKMAFSEGQNHLKMVSFRESTESHNYDLTYQQLNFELDPSVNFIKGSVLSEILILSEHPKSVYFDLSSVLTIDSVSLNHQKTSFVHQSDKIEISLPADIKKDSRHQTIVYYHGSPLQTAMGSFVASAHAGTPIVWTLSEPYGASDWWPCKESLSDKIDSIDVWITCPQQYKAASNGKLISDQVTNNKRTAHWKHRYPIATYLVAVAVTNYETYSDFLPLPEGGSIEILNYIYPEYLSTAKSVAKETLDIMDFFNKKFITYPFATEKYGHAQFGWGGGMEHQTMSFMSHLQFELVAHEMAHQWFGDYVTLGSWHDIWLNEGFATYLAGLTYENLINGVYWTPWKEFQVNRITSSPGGSVYVADTTDVNRIFNGRLSYSKGAFLLHMLRWEMGDEPFFRSLRNYLKDPAIANGFATQSKLVKHLETVANKSFTGFFNDWYYGEGYPTFRITRFIDYGNNGKEMISVSQFSSHPSVSFFEVILPIRVWSKGKSTDLRLNHSHQNQQFIISDTPIDSVQFDPDKWLIAKAEKIILNQTAYLSEKIQIFHRHESKKIHVLLPLNSGTGILKIYDINGRMIHGQQITNHFSEVNTGQFRSGFYLIAVQTNDHRNTEKITINNL